MNRRELFVATGAALALPVAGCVDTADDQPTEIGDVVFESGVNVDKQFDDDPTVTFGESQIRVTGRYSTGNACYDEHLEDPSYNSEDDELRIDITRRHDGSEECDDLEEMVSYRVKVDIDGELPGTVDVTEDMGGETRAER